MRVRAQLKGRARARRQALADRVAGEFFSLPPDQMMAFYDTLTPQQQRAVIRACVAYVGAMIADEGA